MVDLGDLAPTARPFASNPSWTSAPNIATNLRRPWPGFVTLANIANISGSLRLNGGIVIPRGVTVTTITYRSGDTPASGITHNWACLVDTDLNVLAKTAENNAAWAANTDKTFTFAVPYTPDEDMPVYCGHLVVATVNVGQLKGANPGTHSDGKPMAGTSTAGLTDPASLGATAAAISASANHHFIYIA